jgi:hypothetical protein
VSRRLTAWAMIVAMAPLAAARAEENTRSSRI